MNISLLKLGHRSRDGSRWWPVEGYGNGVKLLPSRLTCSTWGATVYWPHTDEAGAECRRGVDLDRHRKLAKQELRNLIATQKG